MSFTFPNIGNLVYRIDIIDRKGFQEKAREQIYLPYVLFRMCLFHVLVFRVRNGMHKTASYVTCSVFFLSLSFTEIISLRLSVQALYQTLKEL